MSRLTLLLLFTLVLSSLHCNAGLSLPSIPCLRCRFQSPQPKENDECAENPSEDCLIRRTLAAHLDYIYTQNHNP